MVVEYDVGIIVMLTGVTEGGITKCARYWPRFKVVNTEVAPEVFERSVLPDLDDSASLQQSFCDSSSQPAVLATKTFTVKAVEEFLMGPIVKRVLDICPKNDVC